MSRAFPSRSDCTVPSVAAIDEALIVVNVPTPPPQAFCFDPTIPIIDPTNFDAGCYEPKLSKSKGPDNKTFRASFKYENEAETGKCEPTLDFTIGCLAPMATLKQGPDNQLVKVSVSNTQGESVGDCNTEFVFSLGCPVPEITLSAGPPNTFAVSVANANPSPGECSLNLEFFVGCPEPKVTVLDGPPNTFVVNVKNVTPSPGACSLSLEFIVGFPSLSDQCIQEFDTELKVTFGDDPGAAPNRFEAKRRMPLPGESSSCQFDFDLDLTIPCNKLAITKALAYLMPPGFPGIFEFEVERKQGCVFEFTFELGIPRPPCPEFETSAKLFIGGPPFLVFDVVRKPVLECEYKLNLFLGIPCPEISTSISIDDDEDIEANTLTFTAEQDETKETSCEYMLTLVGKIPVVGVDDEETSESVVDCCEEMSVVSALKLKKTQGTSKLFLEYDILTFKLPQIFSGEKNGKTIEINCQGSFSAYVSVSLSVLPSCSPCGKRMTFFHDKIKIKGPKLKNKAGTATTAECCTEYTVISSVELSSSNCGHILKYGTLKFSLPKTKLTNIAGTNVALINSGSTIALDNMASADNSGCTPCGVELTSRSKTISLGGKTSDVYVLGSAELVGGSCTKSLILYSKQLKFKHGLFNGQTACATGAACP